MTNDVVRQFATDIERQRAAIIKLQKAYKGQAIFDIALGAGIVILGVELYLLEKEKDKE